MASVGLANQSTECKKSYAQGGGGGNFTNKDEAQLDANGGVLYGMDKELAEKAAAKYDPALEAKCKEWIEALIGEPLAGDTFQEALKSGVALCKAINAIKPGVCPKPFTGKMAFKQMENIANYMDACEKLGVPKFSLFQTVALYENKDMIAVMTNIQALGSAAQKVAGYSGPLLGAKIAQKNEREFTAEQLAAGKAEQTFLGKGSHGTLGSQMGAHIDTSKDIDKMRSVKGTEGLGVDGTTTALGMGSHGQAGTADAFHVDTSKDINRMAKVH